eukprot:1137397-Pelagomonas_calceolata.AAC.2
MSGEAQLNQKSDGGAIIDCACHTQQEGVQGYLVIPVWVSEATGAEWISLSWAGIILGLRWVALPGIGRIKTASGRLWCWTEGPELLGKV